jgi:hypothetical protein
LSTSSSAPTSSTSSASTSIVKVSNRSCLHCDKRGGIKQCSGCHGANFCSKECARAAWPNHKEECKRKQLQAKKRV